MHKVTSLLTLLLVLPAGAQSTATPPADNTPATATQKIGNGVSAPKLIYGPPASYTPEARRVQFNGDVLIRCTVDTDGSVRDAEVVQDPGLGLAESALTTVKTYRFQPAMKDGKPVPVQITVQVGFTIHKK